MRVPASATWPLLFARMHQNSAIVFTVKLLHKSAHDILSDTKHANNEIQHTVKQQDDSFCAANHQPACNISSYYACQALVTRRSTTGASEHAAPTIACFA
jgi:hypothetical protein